MKMNTFRTTPVLDIVQYTGKITPAFKSFVAEHIGSNYMHTDYYDNNMLHIHPLGCGYDKNINLKKNSWLAITANGMIKIYKPDLKSDLLFKFKRFCLRFF